MAMLQLVPVIEVLDTFIRNIVKVDVSTPKNERQHSVNNFGCCIFNNARAMLQLLPVFEVLAIFKGIMVKVDVATPKMSVNRA
jgi:hypothetical protein